MKACVKCGIKRNIMVNAAVEHVDKGFTMKLKTLCLNCFCKGLHIDLRKGMTPDHYSAVMKGK